MRNPCPEDWYDALASPRGVVIKTDDPASYARRLYSIRKRLCDPDLEDLVIVTGVSQQELWLVKRISDA